MERQTVPSQAASLPAALHRVAGARAALRAALRPDRVASLAAAWRTLWRTRLVVWAGGMVGLLALGRDQRWRAFDPAALTAPFGSVGNALVSPAARWDAVWYLAIAHDGYREPVRTAFFPLYPLLVRAAGAAAGSLLVGGVLASMAALLVALYLMHRLASLELGRETATLVVVLVAVFPAAYSLSAVYSESLFLALSVGAVYAARVGRFGWAGAAGALAAATRSAGVVLLVPLALLYLYGPRGDRGAGEPGPWWRPRHQVRPDALWVLLVPVGLGAFLTYLAVRTGRPLEPFQVQDHWLRHFDGLFSGAWDGTVAAVAGLRQLVSGSRAHVYFPQAAGDPFLISAQNLLLFGFLALALVGTVGALRRLPPAYGGYLVAALALPLSYPVSAQPLMSLPRFMAVLFPLHMWLAIWAREHARERWVVWTSAALLAVFSAQFAAWRWVA